MNNFYRYIAFVLLLTVSACSNEFLNENLTTVNNPMGESGIIISPTWDESDYQFSCPGMGDAEFEIVKSPCKSVLHRGSSTIALPLFAARLFFILVLKR